MYKNISGSGACKLLNGTKMKKIYDYCNQVSPKTRASTIYSRFESRKRRKTCIIAKHDAHDIQELINADIRVDEVAATKHFKVNL